MKATPLTLSGPFYLDSLDKSISHIRDVWLIFIITMLYIIKKKLL